MTLRTMEELETAMIQNKITDRARACQLAIEAGNAKDAAFFARSAVSASRELPEAEDLHNEAERFAEPMLRLATQEDPAIVIARQMVADGLASERMKTDLAMFEQNDRIIKRAEAEGLTVGSTIHYYRASTLADLRRAVQNAPATVRWDNRAYTEEAIAAGGVLVIKREAA